MSPDHKALPVNISLLLEMYGTNYRASNGRGYSSNAKLDFHVDGADLTTLICFNKAKSGVKV